MSKGETIEEKGKNEMKNFVNSLLGGYTQPMKLFLIYLAVVLLLSVLVNMGNCYLLYNLSNKIN
jgi:hypothetical protein